VIKIQHRINSVKQLMETPKEYGVEMDIHGFGNRLIVHHNALTDGVDLEHWLEAYQQRFVIFNIKEEGIEQRVCELAEKYAINDYMLLDLSFPALIKMVHRGERRIALRVSEYEHVSSALTLKGQVSWIWLDCFKGFPILVSEYKLLQDAGFKICLVSPELHHPSREGEITKMQQVINNYSLKIDAVCTKIPDKW